MAYSRSHYRIAVSDIAMLAVTLQTTASSPSYNVPECDTPLEEHSEDITCKNCRQSYRKFASDENRPTIYCPFCPPCPARPRAAENSEEVLSPEDADLYAFCPYENFGCGWSGSLADVTYHIVYECLCTPKTLTFRLIEETITMPVIVMMSDFETKRNNNESWYSPVFCTHEKGYHFRLRVDANGWCGTGDAVAVVVSIVKGDYDDQLQWPFEGIITVQALNHISNSAHSVSQKFKFSGGGYECQRVTDETQLEYGCWCDQFIRYDSLYYNQMNNSQYLKVDCLFFLVTYTSILKVVTC